MYVVWITLQRFDLLISLQKHYCFLNENFLNFYPIKLEPIAMLWSLLWYSLIATSNPNSITFLNFLWCNYKLKLQLKLVLICLEMNSRQVWSRHGEIETKMRVIVFGDGDSHIPTLVMGTCGELIFWDMFGINKPFPNGLTFGSLERLNIKIVHKVKS